MKKKLLFIVLTMSVFLYGCETTETESKPELKKYQVKFTTSTFSENAVSLSKVNAAPGLGGKAVGAVGDTLKNHARYLYYRVYNSAGTLINSVEQDFSMENFGTIEDELPSGSYDVVFAASNGTLYIPGENTSFSSSFFYPYADYWEDTFSHRTQVNIGSENLNQTLRLDRQVGAVEVILKDAIPSNATKIAIINNHDAYWYRFDIGAMSSSSQKKKEFTLNSADIGKKDRKFVMHVGNISSPSDITIRAYSDNRVIAEKIVQNVQCYKNQKTVLTGNLFTSGAITSTGFTVTVDPVWNAPGEPINF